MLIFKIPEEYFLDYNADYIATGYFKPGGDGGFGVYEAHSFLLSKCYLK
jgi:hypothetical protein